MSEQKSQNNQVDLNEVLDSIKSAGGTMYKDVNGNSYCPVSLAQLKKWYISLEVAISNADDKEQMKIALRGAKDELIELNKSAELRDLKIQELKGLVGAAEKAKNDLASKLNAQIDHSRKELQATKSRLGEAEKAKVATAAALKETEAKLNSPDAKFDPVAAKLLQNEINGLKADMLLANSAIATEKAMSSNLNKELDGLHKQIAAKDRELAQAKADKATFDKQLAAAKIGNTEVIDFDTLDVDGLTMIYGRRGVEKLKILLGVPNWDVRGKVSKLTGFFHVLSQEFKSKYKAFIDVIDHAFSLLKSEGSTWTAVLAPWVNELIKDVVSLQVKPASTYKSSLKARIEAVRAIPDESTFVRATVGSHAAKDTVSWSDVAKRHIKTAKQARENFDKRRSSWWKKAQAFNKRMYQRMRRGAKQLNKAVNGVKQFFTAAFALLKLAATGQEHHPRFKLGPRARGGNFEDEDEEILRKIELYDEEVD